MTRISADNEGRIQLDRSFLERRHMSPAGEYLLDEREGDMILLQLKPDVRKIYVEATTNCNLQCHTCIRNVWSDPSLHMSQETFRKILESLDSFPQLTRVVFTSFGEPLCHPHILDMIEEIRKREFAVTVGTNGLLLTSCVAEELVRLGVDRLVVSVDGVRPETYQIVRGAQLSQD